MAELNEINGFPLRVAREHNRNERNAGAQTGAQQQALRARTAQQELTRDFAWADAALRSAWQDFPEGLRLVMRAAETAENSWAYRGGKPFLLTLYDLEDLMIRSAGRCELSGVPFSGETIAGSHKRPFIPSIDRIKPKEAYTFDNCRLVCWAVNLALGEWGDAVFLRIALGTAGKRRLP